MMGHCCKAMIAPRTKNGMNVSRAPWRCSNDALYLFRRLTMRLKSTSYMQCTCALVRRDSIMRCAMMRRIGVIGTRSPGIAAGAGVDTGREAGVDGAAPAAGAAGMGL